MSRLNRVAYKQLVDEDIEWLANLAKDKQTSLEYRHIIDILKYSITALYDVPAEGKTNTQQLHGKMPKSCSHCPIVHICGERLMGCENCKNAWGMLQSHFAM
jgi:hypothetical protein